LRHRDEQLRPTPDLVEEGGTVSRNAFAILAKGLAQREQPDERRWRMKVESERGRSRSGDGNRAKEPGG